MIAELPTACDVGTKRNSKGHKESWIGHKLHLDTADGMVPIAAILTSASAHDSQVAIPLARKTNRRVTSLYHIMDTAYDAKAILEDALANEHADVALGDVLDGDPRLRCQRSSRSLTNPVAQASRQVVDSRRCPPRAHRETASSRRRSTPSEACR